MENPFSVAEIVNTAVGDVIREKKRTVELWQFFFG